jgi:hypothetical protein
MSVARKVAEAGPGPLPVRTIYDTPAWRQVVCATYGFADRSIVLGEASLPLFRTASPLLGRKLSSAVFNTYASPAFTDDAQCRALLDAAVAEAGRERVDVIEIKADRPLPADAVRGAGFVERRVYERTLVPLGAADAVVQRLSGKFRRQLQALRRQWGEAGITLERSRDAGDLAEFHDLMVRCYRDAHAMVAQPFALFAGLWADLQPPGRVDLWVVRDGDGVLVAGCLFGLEGDVATGMYSATAPRVRPLAVDTVMKIDAMLTYADAGLAWADLGICSPQQRGLAFAKSRLGGITTSLPYYYRASAARPLPELDYADAYMWLRRPYRWVPVPLAKKIAAGITRYLN